MILAYLQLIIILAVAITVHEFSHAWVAWKLGDPTAKAHGRVSLNPLRHLDPLGTLMIFIAHIGWGKPVPVNPRNFKNPIRDNAIVSFAGPLANLLTAIVATIPYRIFNQINTAAGAAFQQIFDNLIAVCVILFLFNLLPFKPLDGAAILGYFIPQKHFTKYEKWMEDHLAHFMIFVLADLFLLRNLFGFSILETIIYLPAGYLIDFIKLG